MSIRRIFLFLLVAAVFVVAAVIPTNPNENEYYIISGTISYDGLLPDGIVLEVVPGVTVEAGENGYYSARVSPGWSGTVTPTRSGYAFDPYNREYTDVNSNLPDQHYTAHTAHIIVGRNVNMVPYPLTIPDTDPEVIIPNTGDPYLQRQNEPSMAVSTRNPLHLFAGANDYRTVNIPYYSEGPLPGVPVEEATQTLPPDAWLGVFKSYNGGQSWTTTLLPGYPQELGSESPLHGYSTACDPTVRAGPSGLFFYSGIVFDRIDRGRSAIFVARYIDNNTQAMGDMDSMDSIKYLDVSIIDEGTSGQFSDKPWIAVAAPDYGSGTVPINSPGVPTVQDIPRFNVYIVYSIFLGSEQGGGGSKIMFARSTDSGISWERPIKLSESVHICQGTNIVVSPGDDGTVYVSWRQYAREQQGVPHAIMMCKSDDAGNTFTKATEVAPIVPFDQFTGAYRFRTSAFPALAADHQGLVYVAWSQRDTSGVGRIVIKTSKDGINWEGPTTVIDDHTGGGHQIMPSLTYAGGKLMMTWYDTRNSASHSEGSIEGIDQTMDAWVAQANLSDPNSNALENPVFTDSTQASRYIYAYGGDFQEIIQWQFNFVSFPMFIGGTAPFMGDYLDITPSTMFLYDDQDETWHFNTGRGDFDPTLCHITFACNRDVVPPRTDLDPSLNWASYSPPGTGCLGELTTGMRDQNIYTAPITQGFMVGAPVNTKPLAYPSPTTQKRTFLVFVKNLTDYEKLIRLTIVDPPLMGASFWEFETPPDEECPFEHCEAKEVWVPVLPHSTITLTVFVPPYNRPYASLRVNVEEIDGTGVPTGPRSSVVLNPDPVNTQIIPVLPEYHNPTIISEDPDDLILLDPTVLSAYIYTPYLEELLESCNPDIVTPTPRHPTPRHPTPRHETINHTIRNSSITGDLSGAQVTDVNWRVTNDGDATSAYSFELIGETPSVPHQLLIYRVTSTPTSEGCELSELEHHELISSIENPTPRHPTPRHPTPRHPTPRHNTFFLAPGEEAVVTLRLIDPQNPHPFDPDFYAKTVAGSVIPQAADPFGNYEVATGLYIKNEFMPDGFVGKIYPNETNPDILLEADGGSGTYIDWWIVDPVNAPLPLDLELKELEDTEGQPYWIITGTPSFDYNQPPCPNDCYPRVYNFTIAAQDSNGDEAYRNLSITINCDPYTITATPSTATPLKGGKIEAMGYSGDPTSQYSLSVKCGMSQTFTIIPSDCHRIKSVHVDGNPLPGIQFPSENQIQYTFDGETTVVTNPHFIDAEFELIPYTITATATAGGSITEPEPGPGPHEVLCDENITFTIKKTDACYYFQYVVLEDGTQVGPGYTSTETYEFNPIDENTYTFTFKKVRSNHSIVATFARYSYTIEATSTSGGTISPPGDVTVNCGEETTFTITPDTGYQVMYVLVDGQSVGAVSLYTFSFDTDVSYTHTIHAAFGWVRRYNNDSVNKDDEPSDIAVGPSGNPHVTGFSWGDPTGPDFFTTSYDSGGNPQMSARYDGPAHEGDFASAVVVGDEGDFYVTGKSYRGMVQKHSDYSTVKFDSSGNEVWDARYDARRNGMDEATDIALDELEKFVYITGRSQNSESNKSNVLHYDYYTIKYNTRRGRIEWGARYNNDDANGYDGATALDIDSEGNVYVTGRSEGDGTGFDIVTIKYLSGGGLDTSWGDNGIARYPGSNYDDAVAIALDTLGRVYVTGYSSNNPEGTNSDYITIRYLQNGTQDPSWGTAGVARYDVGNDNKAADIAVHEEGEDVFVYVTGYSSNEEDNDYVTIKYDFEGQLVGTWGVGGIARFHGGYGADEAVGLALDSFGNAYVTGKSQGGTTGFDFYTIKYDSSTGDVIWSARYDNSLEVNGSIVLITDDEAVAIAIFEDQGYVNVYVTGKSEGSLTGFDFATIKYEQ